MMPKKASKKYAQKAQKRLLKTPPGDLPEASRRAKSTPRALRTRLRLLQTTYFPAREASGELLIGSLPGLFRRRPGPSGAGRPGTLSGTISGSFSAYFRRVCFGFASARNLISNGTSTHESYLNQREETTDTTRIKGAGTHRTAQ